VRDAVRLDFPVVEAITSILPICDEFVIAVGKGADGTAELIESIDSDKIRIIHTEWDPRLFVRGAINAQQTNVALDECTGDWAFYVQADEVVHEKYLPVVRESMEDNLGRAEVEGLLSAMFTSGEAMRLTTGPIIGIAGRSGLSAMA
jgi:hypothetical protein